jgi:hypothetical protein
MGQFLPSFFDPYLYWEMRGKVRVGYGAKNRPKNRPIGPKSSPFFAYPAAIQQIVLVTPREHSAAAIQQIVLVTPREHHGSRVSDYWGGDTTAGPR